MQPIYTDSVIHSNLDARKMRRFEKASVNDLNTLRQLGFDFSQMAASGYGMDAIQPSVTTPSVITPIQFLQNWLPGFVYVMTAARVIDQLVGIMTTGAWEDAQIVQGIIELLGTAVPYGELSNTMYANWNLNYVTRSVVRFKHGFEVETLEERRSARANVSSGVTKRESSALQLEIARNAVGFLGYNGGNNSTYGFLNDPGLPAYVTVPPGASTHTQWSTKTYLEITADIRTAFATLRTQGLGNFDPEQTPATLVLPTAVIDYLSTSTDFGYSVKKWLEESYPNTRIMSAPELDGANGGANVFYLYAERTNDSSTDGGQNFIQMIPQKFMVLGVEKTIDGYKEAYSNATAGVMCKRPWLVVRYSGI